MRKNRWVLRCALLTLTGVALLNVFSCKRPGSAGESVSVVEAKSSHDEMRGGNAMSLALTTTAFTNGGAIAKKYTCDGADLSPALNWSGVPAGAQSLALITDDPDAPMGTWTHWIIWNIPASATALPEGVPASDVLDNGARQGRNDFRRIGYGGPCPPPGRPHRYFFRLYALDTRLDLKAGSARSQLEAAMKSHVLSQAELMGTYGR